MKARVLAVYDRSPLGDLAIEAALRFAGSHDVAVLHILAVPGLPGDAVQREALNDDLLAFARLGLRLEVVVDGGVIDVLDAERLMAEMQQREIDHLVIAKPAGADANTAIGRMLDAAAEAAGIATLVVREEGP